MDEDDKPPTTKPPRWARPMSDRFLHGMFITFAILFVLLAISQFAIGRLENVIFGLSDLAASFVWFGFVLIRRVWLHIGYRRGR